MNNRILAFGAVCLFAAFPSCVGEVMLPSQLIQTSHALKASYTNLAKDLGSQRPWDDKHQLSETQKQSLDQLEQLANDLMQQSDRASTMLDLFSQYKNNDGYPRQKLLKAVFAGRVFQPSDLPFLKTLLLASVTWRFEDDPRASHLIWYNSRSLRREFGHALIGAAKQQSLADNPDWDLLDGNPSAWLTKYIP